MPGAPNRPPEIAAPPPPPVADAPDRKILRRLAPSHVALLLDSWKGPVAPEVLEPFEKAEASLAKGDYPTATTALDLLSIRFAEPRWPTLPEPFRRLRVAIPAPVPPHWDPDHELAAAEKDARKARRTAEEQLVLAEGCIAWGAAHGVETGDLATLLTEAKGRLGEQGVGPEFYPKLDELWLRLRGRLPRPKTRSKGPVAPPSDEAT